MNVEEFWNLTFDEFYDISRAHIKRIEAVERMEWERARFVAFYALAPHSRKKLKPKDLIEFEWEKQEQAKELEKIKKVDFDAIFPKTMKA